MSDRHDVVRVLEHYASLYRARDLSRLDEAMAIFACADDPEMVGTEAVVRGDADWATGPDAVRALTEWDWRWWWDVELDVGAARVTVSGDVAWTSMPASLVASERALRSPRGERRSMTLTAVLVRRDGDWLLHTTHWAIAAD